MRKPLGYLISAGLVMCLVFTACTDDSPADDSTDPKVESGEPAGSIDAATDQAALSMELLQITGCDADGNRRVFLDSSLSPESPGVDVRWLHDDQADEGVTPVGAYSFSVTGDDQVHTFEVTAAPQTAAAGATLDVEVPGCDESLTADRDVVLGEIVSVDVGECDDAGFREVSLAGAVRPAGSEATVQWTVDGQALAAPGPVAPAVTQVAGDGQVLVVELRVLSPEDGLRATRDVDVPACEDGAAATAGAGGVSGEIVSVDVGDCDAVGFRAISLVGALKPAGSEATVQWIVDGQALAPPGPVAPAVVQVSADGQPHSVELRLLSPQGSVGDSTQFEVPGCGPSTEVTAEIVSLEIGDCDETGFREVSLVGGVSPAGSDATVQWIVDGRALAAPGPVGSTVAPVAGDDQIHTAELRVLLPDGGVGAQEDFDAPACAG